MIRSECESSFLNVACEREGSLRGKGRESALRDTERAASGAGEARICGQLSCVNEWDVRGRVPAEFAEFNTAITEYMQSEFSVDEQRSSDLHEQTGARAAALNFGANGQLSRAGGAVAEAQGGGGKEQLRALAIHAEHASQTPPHVRASGRRGQRAGARRVLRDAVRARWHRAAGCGTQRGRLYGAIGAPETGGQLAPWRQVARFVQRSWRHGRKRPGDATEEQREAAQRGGGGAQLQIVEGSVAEAGRLQVHSDGGALSSCAAQPGQAAGGGAASGGTGSRYSGTEADCAGSSARVREAAVRVQAAWRARRAWQGRPRSKLPADRKHADKSGPNWVQAAVRVQNWWHALRGRVVHVDATGERGNGARQETSIESGWRGKRAKHLGNLESHVRFLQWLVRGVRSVRSGAMVRWKVAAAVVLAFGRQKRRPACGFGANLASDQEFEDQRALAADWLDHYAVYVEILRKLESGDTPTVLQAFCGGGGQAEGQRRAGGRVVGTDLYEQSDFRRHFSTDAFVQGDSVSWAHLAKLRDTWQCWGCSGGPPCKFYSRARVRGEAKQPPLIEQARDAFAALFDLWSIENVLGARLHLAAHATELDGALFGLRVARARLFESNFELVVDEAVRGPAEALRQRMCLGERRRWRHFDRWGRPERRQCCGGNIFSPLGTHPWKCTVEECSRAMGVDVGHMSYERLAQSVPPAYGQLVFAQMCMHRAHRRYGVPMLTFDQRLADPSGVARQLTFWLHGAGAESAAVGMQLLPHGPQDGQSEASGSTEFQAAGEEAHASEGAESEQASARAPGRVEESEPEDLGEQHLAGEGGVVGAGRLGDGGAPTEERQGSLRAAQAQMGGLPQDLCRTEVAAGAGTAGQGSVLGTGRAKSSAVGVVEFRELYYSHAGGYGQQWVSPGVSGRLEDVSAGEVVTLEAEGLVAEKLQGHNTFVELEDSQFESALGLVMEALSVSDRTGTRVTMVADVSRAEQLERCGFERLSCSTKYGGGDALEKQGKVAYCRGRRSVRPAGRLEHKDVEPFMDWRDRTGWKPDPDEKRRLTWEPMPHDPSRWQGMGLPEDVERMMVEGLKVEMEVDCPPFEVPQYAFPTGEALLECANELNRGLCVGAFEYVPEEELQGLPGIIHPFTMDLKGDKWRACCDYKAGTNQGARSGPFGLPSPFDVRAVLGPDSHMVKYDLRDGFWAVPIHPESRNRLILRHPINGRPVRACRLPFGFVDSPRAFCRLTESLAEILRKRLAGMGVHVFVFVDDFLLVGKDEETARLAGQALEDLLDEVGMCWAPHKQRGPCKCIEFLGLLISNVPGHRCISLTEKRQVKLQGMISEWLAREPGRGEKMRAGPVELARLLGHLVFASQVVEGGRTYMQGMLGQFAGLEVDWRRGEVKWVKSQAARWEKGVEVSSGFWRDLKWWSDHLEYRNSVSLEVPRAGEAAVTGTDASDWGTGQLAWIDGHRAESVLVFTEAEKRRSINWRELLGILRVVQRFGGELRGKCILVETDNMAAKGAAQKLSSKAEDSQELVRRLLEAAEEFGVQLRFTHTPGVKLVRPDQTSRGLPVEEPRVRLAAGLFRLLEARFGPFDEILGGERRVAAAGQGRSRLFMHPTFATVATALRMIGERLMASDGERVTGVVVVPFAPEAKWWGLLRHFTVVGHSDVGQQGQLEMNQAGSWQPVRVRRAFLMLAFPRAAGAVVRPVRAPTESQGYVQSVHGGSGFFLPLPAGAMLYGPSGQKGQRGCLYRVWRNFDPGQGEGLRVDEDDTPCVAVVELKLDVGKGGKQVAGDVYVLDRRSGAWKDGRWGPGSFSSANFRPWEVNASLLWTVDHLVQVGDGQRGSVRHDLKTEERLRFGFDYRRAEREVQRARAAVGEGDVAMTPAASEVSSRRGTPLNTPLVLSDGAEARARAAAVAGELQAAAEEPDAEAALARARESAAEAAAARARPPAREQTEPAARRAMAGGAEGPTYPCRYEHLECAGCHKPIGLGTMMRAGGKGMVHAEGDCWELARKELAESLKRRAAGDRAARAAEGAELRQARLGHRLSDDRKAIVLGCLSGTCGHVRRTQIACRAGCGRSLHAECAMVSSGAVALGNLICCFCRAKSLVVSSCSPTERLVERMVGPMLLELTSGATSTSHGYADFVNLERRFVLEVAGDDLPVVAVRLPHQVEEAFLAFIEWLVTDGPRARSLGTTMVAASGYMTKLGMEDWTKSKRVKAYIKELNVSGGAETVPCTPVTSLMVKYMVDYTLPEVTSRVGYLQDYYLARALAALLIELGGGARVGEATGDLHGMLANNACIQRLVHPPEGDLGETIEMKLEDSKTYLGRHLVFVGESRGTGLPFAEWLRSYWRACNIAVDQVEKDGFLEERPDYSVVRVSLLDMSDDIFEVFIKEVKRTVDEEIVKQRPAILKYAKDKREARSLGEEKRYVNLTGGRREGREVAAGVAWMEKRGWGRFVKVVKGPLLRASLGKLITHTPLEESGIANHVVVAMRLAREMIEAEGLIDPEFDQQVGAIWGTHSLRRQADRVATRTRADTGATSQEINAVFGWELKKMREEMQVWYAGLDRMQRLALAKVTMMV